MNEKSIVYGKSKRFALRVVNLYKYLVNDKQEKVMSKQLLRCGTSVGANLAEAVCAASRPDFLNKVYISLKECNETRYWLELLKDANIISGAQFESIFEDANELFKLLMSITKTLKSTRKEPPTSHLPPPNF